MYELVLRLKILRRKRFVVFWDFQETGQFPSQTTTRWPGGTDKGLGRPRRQLKRWMIKGKQTVECCLQCVTGISTSCSPLNNTMAAVQSMKVNLDFIHCNNCMLQSISFTLQPRLWARATCAREQLFFIFSHFLGSISVSCQKMLICSAAACPTTLDSP